MKIIAGIIVLLALGAGAWYFSGGNLADFSPTSNTPTTQENPSDDGTFNGSMKELIARGGSWQCVVTVTVQGIVSSGTTFLSNGMLRGDFSSTVPQLGTVETHIIMRDTTAYTWTSLAKTGFKFAVEGDSSTSATNAQAAALFNQPYDYRCTAWTADTSKFTLPSDITF